MLQIPIFHVNGEDPEAVAQVVRLAMDFRARSSATSSSTCTATAATATTRATSRPSRSRCCTGRSRSARACATATSSTCCSLGDVTREEADEIALERREQLELELERGAPRRLRAHPRLAGRRLEGLPRRPRRRRAGRRHRRDARACSPSCSKRATRSARRTSTRTRRSSACSTTRREMAAGEQPLDWGAAETLAFASLVTRGRARPPDRPGLRARHVQPSPRRAARRRERPATTCRSAHSPRTRRRSRSTTARCREAGVLGFEYGYSLDWPDGARAVGSAVRRLRERRAGHHRPVHRQRRRQVAAPQRPRAAPAARLRRAGPGALERPARALPGAVRRGQHPGRPPDDAGAVLPPAAPPGAAPLAQAAHRDDAEEPAAPPAAPSADIDEFDGRYASSASCRTRAPTSRTRSASSCAPARSTTSSIGSGTERKRDDVAIVRLEQLYPLPDGATSSTAPARRTRDGTPVVWVQEEPENMGAWRFLRSRFGERLLGRFPLSVRVAPRVRQPGDRLGAHATSSKQQQLMDAAFA